MTISLVTLIVNIIIGGLLGIVAIGWTCFFVTAFHACWCWLRRRLARPAYRIEKTAYGQVIWPMSKDK